MDADTALVVSRRYRWYTFFLGRFGGTTDRVDTADPDAAAAAIRAWEKDTRARHILMKMDSDHVALIYGTRGEVELHGSPAYVPGSRLDCALDWCPFGISLRYSDICRNCPHSSAATRLPPQYT